MKTWIAGIFILLLPGLAIAAEPRLEGVCALIDKNVNKLLQVNISECMPGKGSKPGSYSFVFVAKLPVSNDEQNRRAWIMTTIGGTGWAMMELPEMKGVNIEDIRLTDPILARRKAFIVLSGADVKRWRKDIASGKLQLLDAYAQVQKSSHEIIVEKK